jgi:hypothetical protein
VKRVVIATVMVAAAAALYALRLDDVAGLAKDDAYYMLLAQSLATGHGYALISSATTPILPAFPPGFALVLAPVFGVIPRFPDNLIWLKAVSIVAMLATGLLTFQYWHRYRDMRAGRSATVAWLATLTPGFVFLATSTVMSECVFTLALMGSAVAIERATRAQDPARSRGAVIVAALITTAAWLIRASGIALVASGALFLFWRRGWRAAAAFVVVCALSYAPWYAYDATHRPTEAERFAYGGDVARYYQSPLASRGQEPPVHVDDLIRRVSINLVNIFGRDLGAAIFPAGYRGANESGLEVFLLSGSTGLRAGSMGIGPALVAVSFVISLFVIVGAITLARRRTGVAEVFCIVTIGLLLVISSHTFRYALPMTPFVIGYFLVGIEAAAARVRAQAAASAFRIAAGCLLFFVIIEHSGYVWRKFNGPSPAWIEDGREVRAVTDFVNQHLPAGASAASTNPGLIYLATGRKAVPYVDPDARWEQWRRAGIRYIVALHDVPRPDASSGYEVLYESPRLGLWVLKMNAEAD